MRVYVMLVQFSFSPPGPVIVVDYSYNADEAVRHIEGQQFVDGRVHASFRNGAI